MENIIKGIIALQKTDIAFTDLKLREVADKEGECLGSKGRNLYQVWDDGEIKEWINDRRDISLKTLRRQYIAEVEKQAICQALELTQWNRKSAAKLLRVSYKTLLTRVEEFNLM